VLFPPNKALKDELLTSGGPLRKSAWGAFTPHTFIRFYFDKTLSMKYAYPYSVGMLDRGLPH
jgi:hypothetical protein